MEDKMTTANNLKIIAVNVIFAQVLKTDHIQEALGAHKQMLFKRVYNIFGERAIAVMLK